MHTILDAGCGNGYMAKLFVQEMRGSGIVYALDPDTFFIDTLKSNTGQSNIRAMVGDITTHTGLNPAGFDLIYLSTVLHSFSNSQVQGFIREAKRLLKPGALLAIVEIEKKETPFGPPLHLRYSPEELKQAISMQPKQTVTVGDHFYMQTFQN